MTARGTVVVTGAAGSVGRTTVEGLIGLGWTVRQLDRVSTMASYDAPHTTWVADAASPTTLDEVLPGADAVVHLAAYPREAGIEEIATSHVVGTARMIEAMIRAGVRRLVVASSNHAVGMVPAGATAPADVGPRPDTYYGVGKVATEALCSLATDRAGLDTVCLRIGSFSPRPTTLRHLATWLSPGDLVRLVDAALTAPAPGHVVGFGISANTRAWWDLSSVRRLGYHPQDDAEAYADEVDASRTEDLDFLGGEYAREIATFGGLAWGMPGPVPG